MAEAIVSQISKEMEDAGIITHTTGKTNSYFKDGREYLILVSAIDITDWQQEDDRSAGGKPTAISDRASPRRRAFPQAQLPGIRRGQEGRGRDDPGDRGD